jgi:hypothetical protein
MAAINACIVCHHRRSDPTVALVHPVFSRQLMQLYRRSPSGHATPEAWLVARKASKQAPSVPVYKTFTIKVYTRPNKGGRAVIPVDPNLSDPFSAMAYHIVAAGGTGTRFVTLQLNGEPVTKKSQLEALRHAAPYSLQVMHGASGRHAIEVPSNAPVAPLVEETTLSSANPAASSAPAKKMTLADAFTAKSGSPDDTTLSVLMRNISDGFGESMHQAAQKANLPENSLLNGYHVAHATAHKVVMDPELYRRTLTERGMPEEDAAKVTPDAFWDELAQLSAADAADAISKSIATSAAGMPNSAVTKEPRRHYSNAANRSHIFRNFGTGLRNFLLGVTSGPYWSYRISPSYSVYHYLPEETVPVPLGVTPVLPVPYGYPRYGRGRRWLMMKPFRMAVASADEADSQTAAQAQIETFQGERQAALAKHLAAASAANADFDVEIKPAAAAVDVMTSVMASEGFSGSSMPGLVMVESAAGPLSSMPGLVMVESAASALSSMPGLATAQVAAAGASMPSLVALPAQAPVADIGAVNFSVPSMLEQPEPIVAASPMASLLAASDLDAKLPKLDRASISPLSAELLAAAGADLAESCVMILPEIPRDNVYKAITAKMSAKRGSDRLNAAKSIADHYTVPGSGHAEQLRTFLAGETNSVQLNTRAVGSFWRLSRTPGGALQLRNSKGTTAYAAAYQHDELPHVMVFTVDTHHNK